MEHSKNFEKVKSYYDTYVSTNGKMGWSLERVQQAVVKGWITEEEYNEIVNKD